MSREIRLKVLRRDDCGLCVLLPKSAWRDAPEPGRACNALVDGVRRRLRVFSELCNCRGTGEHEHRFLVLPRSAGVAAGAYCAISLG